jgi:glycerate kinase
MLHRTLPEYIYGVLPKPAELQGVKCYLETPLGEGKVDFQTAKGKTAAGVLARAKAAGIPVVAIGGCVERCDSLDAMGFAGVYPILEEKVPLEVAMQHDFASANVTRTVARIVSQMD